MKQPNERSALARRHLLGAAAGAAGALVAASTLLPSAPEVATPEGAQPAAPDKAGGYQASAHVLQYYQTARV